MKKIIIICFCFFLSCEKKNEYFISDEIYKTITESVDDIHNKISKTDSIFYVFNRHDTLIIMSSKYEGILRPTYTVDNIGYFNYKKNKIIITRPYKPIFTIIKENNKLNDPINGLKPPYYDGDDYQKGVVYKIKDVNHLEIIEKGNLKKYFKPMGEYELPAPPPPSKE